MTWNKTIDKDNVSFKEKTNRFFLLRLWVHGKLLHRWVFLVEQPYKTRPWLQQCSDSKIEMVNCTMPRGILEELPVLLLLLIRQQWFYIHPQAKVLRNICLVELEIQTPKWIPRYRGKNSSSHQAQPDASCGEARAVPWGSLLWHLKEYLEEHPETHKQELPCPYWSLVTKSVMTRFCLLSCFQVKISVLMRKSNDDSMQSLCNLKAQQSLGCTFSCSWISLCDHYHSACTEGCIMSNAATARAHGAAPPTAGYRGCWVYMRRTFQKHTSLSPHYYTLNFFSKKAVMLGQLSENSGKPAAFLGGSGAQRQHKNRCTDKF